MNLPPLVLIIFAVAIVSNAVANILMGIGMKGKSLKGVSIGQVFTDIVLTVPFITGVTSFGIALIAYNYVLSHIPLSMAYPIMTTLGFMIVILVTHLTMGEMLHWQQWIGVVLILGGVWLVASRIG
jgi:multidrug transporter EmrE-like cation transporter